jgi:hypothetical protein
MSIFHLSNLLFSEIPNNFFQYLFAICYYYSYYCYHHHYYYYYYYYYCNCYCYCYYFRCTYRHCTGEWSLHRLLLAYFCALFASHQGSCVVAVVVVLERFFFLVGRHMLARYICLLILQEPTQMPTQRPTHEPTLRPSREPTSKTLSESFAFSNSHMQ